ncbi:GTPase activating protein Bud2p [[Candida] anglica]|uniref:GTPase activating protein Bud2p n=1 Tax=[Candida] anglica TaxID=148631 RepID=A0ABP0EM55_9ASCO
MKYQTPFHKVIARDKGVFNGRNLYMSTDAVTWTHSYALMITDQGSLYSSDENDSPYVVLSSLQSCFVQVIPDVNGGTHLNNPILPHNNRRRVSSRRVASGGSANASAEDLGGNGHHGSSNGSMTAANANGGLSDEPPVVFIKTFDNEKLYIKVPSKTNFGNLLASLIVWQNLKPQGLVKKWYSENRVNHNSSSTHEVLVCRFKVYGPIPTKSKNLRILPGVPAPSYQPPKRDQDGLHHVTGGGGGSDSGTPHANLSTQPIQEGWFYTMGVLKSNGMLNFITELDGTLLYSIDVKTVMSSEIREMHHSIFDNSNVLFVGRIKELRWNNCIKTVTPNSFNDQDEPFLFRDGKILNSNQRILIEFPLHIDLEDWFVGLNYFAKREYIGSFNPESPQQSSQYNNGHKKVTATVPPTTMNSDDANTSIASSTGTSATYIMNGSKNASMGDLSVNSNNQNATNTTVSTSQNTTNPSTTLDDYTKDNLRVSKNVSIDIIEAKFDSNNNKSDKIYAEVVMWGLPWSRTAIVAHTHNPFWKEEFSTNLPISTQIVHILIKQCSGSTYSLHDKVIGTVYITPDILTKQLSTSSTMMTGSPLGMGINVGGNGGFSANTAAANAPTGNVAINDIVRLSIYDSSNLPMGKLLLTVNLKEYHILAPRNFKTLENMLCNAPMKDLIKFCNNNVPTSDFENVSLIMLDIFQSLGIEDLWFKSLMEVELINVDKITRKNYVTNKRNSGVPSATTTKSSNNVFNTLFRGSSIFSKSLEKYNLRIGQEYLEKVFGDFFAKISRERKSCEVDPRYVKLQTGLGGLRNGHRNGNGGDSSGNSDSDDSDSDDSDGYDSEEEREKEAQLKLIVEENFINLYEYAEEIWNKIYITSNDLPQQIKTQLKNFRSKVELACDPEDKTTALNCLSAFIFLRFFCPAILNPKLFYLTKDHQTGETQRTLTLIAKILLNLANRQEFSPHKEPHLVKMNEFLSRHQAEVLDYFDKITGRKNDFNEKILDLSHEVKRFDLGLSGDATSSELPTTPYLIDKYLRLTELIHLLDYNQPTSTSNRSSVGGQTIRSSISIPSNSTKRASDGGYGYNNGRESQIRDSYAARDSFRESNGDIHVNAERNVYQIGSLEFEKSEFLDLAGDNETEGFLKSLCRSNENIFSFITSNITLKDLQKQSTNLMSKVNNLEMFLESTELPINYQTDSKMWDAFTEEILSRAYLDTTRNCITYWHGPEDMTPSSLKRLTDNALTGLKLRFPDTSRFDTESPRVSSTFSTSTLSSALKGGKKNPFKKWLSRERGVSR